MIELPEQMVAWRVRYAISQETAAQLAHVSVRAWRNWERRRFRPRDDNYVAVRWVISQPPPWHGGNV